MKTHIFFLASKLMIPMMVLYSLTSIGQVTYVDFTPDYYADTSKDTTIPLDIDSNGSVDVDINHFIYYMETIGNTFYAEAKYGHEISGYTEGYYDWPRGYEFGDSIVPEPLWIQDGVLLDNLYLNDGDWIDNPIGYLGVKLRINNQYHYAWLRIQFKNKRMVWIMDAAISDIPGQSIIAGEGIPSGATSVHAIDREDYFDARDIQVSFAKAIDDTIFSAYRIIIAKAEDSTVNDLNLMSSLPIESYTAKQVYPDDQNYVHSLILASYKLDKDGDPFITNRDYKAYVLNISKSGDTMQNILSIGSLPFQLSAASQPVKNLVAYDERNDLNSSDVKVKFSRADHEELINEYRIFIAPYGMNATADELLSLSNAFHTSVSPINSNQYDQFIKPDQMDITGNIIAEHIPYQIYVVSVADSIYSFTSSVKSTDSKIYLKNPNDIRAGQEEGIPFIEYSIPLNFNFYDVGKYEFDLNQDSIADIELLGTYWEGNTFQFWEYNIKPKRANEILLCDHSEHSNWINPMQDDDMISEEMYWTKGEGLLYYYDYDGNNGFTSYGHFDEDHNYYVGFKINDYDQPQYGWIKLYSGYYEIKIYSYAYQDLPAYTNEKLAGSKLITWDEKNQNNSNDIQISFNPAEKEEMINEYRIFVAPYGSDYNVTELSSLPDEYFTIIVPNASTSYSSAIKSGQLDIIGNPIAENIAYEIILLSLVDNTNSALNAVSRTQRKVILRNPNDLQAGQTEGDHIFYNEFTSPIELEYNGVSNDKIDLDQDNIPDIEFKGFFVTKNNSQTLEYKLLPLRNNTILICDHVEHQSWVEALRDHEQIGTGFNESVGLCLLAGSSTDDSTISNGYFIDDEVRYVGYVIHDHEIPAYGWIKLKVLDDRIIIYGTVNYDIASYSDEYFTTDLEIYPNPTKEYINILVNSHKGNYGQVRATILDSKGKTLEEFKFVGSRYKHNISNLPSGMYFCITEDENSNKKIQKFIVK